MKPNPAGTAAAARPLPRAFFDRPPERVAPELVGKLLVRRIGGARLCGRIVETEAYGGADDPAAHAARGLTRRTAVLFGPPGHAYVYFSYGMHWCLNVSTLPAGQPGGVLLRALEPLAGQAAMLRRAPIADLRRLLSGPGRLTRALGITGADNAADLTRAGSLYLAGDGFHAPAIAVTPRVGITQARERPFRFYLEGSPAVTRARVPVLQRWRRQ